MHTFKNTFSSAFKIWLPIALVIVIFSSLAYILVQQSYRMSANDPQIQIAEDVANAISKGDAAPDSIVDPNPAEDISSGLSPFVAIYSATGTPIGSSVAVNGELPTIPVKNFDYAKEHGQDRFTWQPSPGVRIAAVVAYFEGSEPGFVLAGRSLREVEIRQFQALLISIIACALALILSFAAILFVGKEFLHSHKKPDEELTASLQ